ncbi:hypothetical protein GCM10022226_49710 [Sphaerisporangium flaviroseum]|uniref:Uncharacterized protein n=1 Tax=Sphaerisporangium flaviroseum TaxID=509199 RepID=A0ABP7IP01_9ACTN
MNFCLSDLVPPLRWSDATGFAQLRDVPGLPDAWWRAVPVSRVFVVLGPEALGELLTELAMEHWPAAAVGDILPALHVMDPDEADEPQVSIALDRVGSWFGLLSLTGRELTDQPFIRARPILTALFTAVFVRLAPSGDQSGDHAARSAAKSQGRASKQAAAAEAAPAETRDAVQETPLRAARAGESPVSAGKAPETSVRVSKTPAKAGDRSPTGSSPEAAPLPVRRVPKAEPLPVRSPSRLPKRQKASIDPGDPLGLAAARLAEAALRQPASRDLPADGSPVGAPGARTSMFTPPPRAERPFPAPDAPSFGTDGQGFSAAPRPFVPEPEPFDPAPLGLGAYGKDLRPFPSEPPEPSGPSEPLDGPQAREGGEDREHEDPPASEGADTPQGISADDLGTGRTERDDIPALIDSAFADLDDKTWAVAQNHVFTDSPAAPEELAKLFAVSPEDILALEEELRTRLAGWLDGADAAPYTQHLEKLPGTLGVAAPKSRLIGAAEWHTRELRSLDVPAWQFVLATLPGYTVQDDWLVSGDIAELREQTCALILNAERPPTVARALELVSTLGIHPEIAKEWLENVPQLRIQSTKKGSTSGQDDQADGPSDPEGPQSAPTGQLKDVSMTRRCFRHPDGLWWLRVDVLPDQLTGGECPLPSGFASYLGMTPGDSHTVETTAGEVILTWQARPVIDSLGPLLNELGAQPGAHLFLTVAEEDKVLRTRLVPASPADLDKTTLALRLSGHTAKGKPESLEETIRVLATRIGMTGPVGLPDLMNRLRERGDRDLLSLMV